ncbi:MAG: YraN family protein [Candidatus Nomurabacteria bacterium]|nr:MAG: YraN family protein [Candidatus Nomurabacteria bacterium]HRV76107.1 YraN family protein [Candidatus Saccharimonadales bacterium]
MPNTTSIGRLAEQHAATYLINTFEYKLLAQNWRTRTCEIDLVMYKNQTVYFIEVKYRHHSDSGTGLEAINKKKLTQMRRASYEWLKFNPEYSHFQRTLSAIELAGSQFDITNFVESIVEY